MSETKEESNSPSDLKEEEKSLNTEDNKTVDESSKDSAKDDSVKEESGKGSGKESAADDDDDEEEEEEESEEGMGLLDRPVEVTGCRARKKVERLEYSFEKANKQIEIPVGKGSKLGDCPRIEHHIQKTSVDELKPLHRILFNRIGPGNEIKKNIRKFSGFSFVKDSPEFDKKKTSAEKFNSVAILKRVCDILDIERGGTKDDIVNRILEYLLEPKDSGRAVPQKKSVSKRKSSVKKANSKKPKGKKEASSDEQDNANKSASEEVNENEDSASESDYESKKKSKTPPKAKKTPSKTKKPEKKEKSKKEEKKSSAKRKRDSSSSESSDEEPSTKKTKMPSDEEIKKLVKRILDAADLQEITMKKVIKQVADAYPDCDLSHKKGFIKTTIKSVIS